MGEIGPKESELRVDAVLVEVAHWAWGSGIMVVVERVKASYATAGLEKESTMHKMRTARRTEQPPFGAQVAFARVATGR